MEKRNKKKKKTKTKQKKKKKMRQERVKKGVTCHQEICSYWWRFLSPEGVRRDLEC